MAVAPKARKGRPSDPLDWLREWASLDQNFQPPSDRLIARQLLADAALSDRLAALYKALTSRGGADSARETIRQLLDDCIVVSGVVAGRPRTDKSPTAVPPPTRTEQSRELRALANDIKGMIRKFKDHSDALDHATSVAYLTARHEAGNPANYSRSRKPSLRQNRQIFQMDFTIKHLLMALRDDITETADQIQRNIRRKRQTGSHDALAGAMIDHVGRLARAAWGSMTRPSPALLVLELSRELLTARGFPRTTLDESTVRSRLKKLSKS